MKICVLCMVSKIWHKLIRTNVTLTLEHPFTKYFNLRTDLRFSDFRFSGKEFKRYVPKDTMVFLGYPKELRQCTSTMSQWHGQWKKCIIKLGFIPFIQSKNHVHSFRAFQG